MKFPHLILPYAGAAVAICLPVSAFAQTSTWSGGGSDDNWSTNANWNPVGSPANSNVIFNDTDKSPASSTVNSVVDASTTLQSLTFSNLGATDADWHVLNINEGVTLTLDAVTPPSTILKVGGMSGASYTTRVKIGGEGALAINETGSNIVVGNTGATGTSTATLDLSGLSSFTANVSSVRIGVGVVSQGIMTLATTNSLKGGTLTVGNSANSDTPTQGPTSQLNLGRTNELYFDNIYIGSVGSGTRNGNSGILQFQTLGDGPTPSVVIRGTDSTELNPTRANLIIGRTTTTSGSGSNVSNTSLVDFTGGTVDALFDDVVIGNGGSSSGGSSVSATLSMDEGTINASSVSVGMTSGNGGDQTQAARATTGNLNIAGGTFTAAALTVANNASKGMNVFGNLNVSGGALNATSGIVMGRRHTNDSYDKPYFVTAVADFTGGEVTVGGDIAEGTGDRAVISSTLKLRGGTLDLDGHSVAVDTFTVESGTIRDAGEFYLDDGTTARSLVKSTSGTLVLEGTNAYTGTTEVNLGNLTVNGSLTSSSVNAAATTRIAGNGDIGGSLTMQSGSTLSPGNGGIDTLAAGSLSWNNDATFEFALSAVNNTSDRINLDTAFTIGTDGVFLFDFLNGGHAGGTYTLVTFASTSFTSGSQFTYQNLGGGLEGEFVLNGSSLVFAIPVPEPSTWVLLTLGAAFGIFCRSRRLRH